MSRARPNASPQLRLVHGEPAEGIREEQSAEPRAVSGPARSLDDHELLSAVRSGDEAAATLFYHRVRPQVAATVARMLGTRDRDFEDIAQVSMVELVRSVHTFRGDCALDSWVFRVTSYVVCKQIRRRRVESGIFGSVPVDGEDGGRSGRALVARSLLERIRGHLAELDEGKAPLEIAVDRKNKGLSYWIF